MTLEQFAVASGADPKWVKNAFAAVGAAPVYTEDEARCLGLTRVISATTGLPVRRAYAAAREALAHGDQAAFPISEAHDGSVRITVDVPRYVSTFLTRLALARKAGERVRGRPAKRPADPIEYAREYGIDISLLESNLQRTPEERLRIASANSEFIRRFRGSASR
jgi:hypothetical protein